MISCRCREIYISLPHITIKSTLMTHAGHRAYKKVDQRNRPCDLDRSQYEEENLSTEVTEEDLANAWTDEYGVKYSADRKRVLWAPSNIQTYSIKEGTIIICDRAFNDSPNSGNTQLISVVIPESVTHIGNSAFQNCFSLETISIPNSVQYIGNAAFSHCFNINISIPNSVNFIGDSAFWNCRSLSLFVIPESVTYIGSMAFANCYSLTQVSILGQVESIKAQTFADCFWLNKVILPNSISHIESRAFYECYRLEEIVFPDSIQVIDECAFDDCRSLLSVVLPNTLVHIGYGAFRGCESLTEVVIPTAITTIDKYVFQDTYSLSEISIPESVVNIEEAAFQCSGLTRLYINSIVDINDKAFDGCSLQSILIPQGTTMIFEKSLSEFKDKLVEQDGLEDLSVEVTEEDLANAWTDEFGVKYSTDKKRLLKAPMGLREYTIKAGTMVICNMSFSEFVGGGMKKEFSGISSIIIPSSVEQIGRHAFMCCDNLRHIYIPVLIKKKFEELIPGYKYKLVEILDINNKDGWRIKERRPFNLDEINRVSYAQVVDSQFGNSAGFYMNSGGFTHIPLVSYSSLALGDIVDLSKANIVILSKDGDVDIMRVEAL